MTSSETTATDQLDTPEKLNGQSLNLRDQRLAALKAIVPEAFDLDGNLVRDKLLEALKPASYDAASAADDIPAFGLGWPGKQQAFAAAGVPTTATLRPCREQSVDFDTTGHLLIEGDNLEVLKTLQRAYHGKVKMIYIDPPYNTGKDFVYPDNYSEGLDTYLQRTQQKDGDGFWKSTNSETSGRKHANWLSMMAPRLTLARNLLREDGVIFISIGDEEEANLRLLCDEVFGAENFCNTIAVEMSTTSGPKTVNAQQGTIVKNIEFVHVYRKSMAFDESVRTPLLDGIDLYDTHYTIWMNDDGTLESLADVMMRNDSIRADVENNGLKGRNGFSVNSMDRLLAISETARTFINDNLKRIARVDRPPVSAREASPDVGKWETFRADHRDYLLTTLDSGSLQALIPLHANYRMSDDYKPRFGRTVIRGDLWKGFYQDMGNVAKEGGLVFDNGKKPIRLIKQFCKWVTLQDGDVLLDFFAGSGTTGHAVMAQNAEDGGKRRYICVQLPEPLDEPVTLDDGVVCETIFDLTRERLKRAGRKIKEEAGLNAEKQDTGLRVFKLDSSNFTAWNSDPTASEADLLARLEQLADHTVPGRSEMDILWEVLLKMGLTLDLQLERFEVEGASFIGVADRTRVISTASAIPVAAFEALLDQPPEQGGPPAELVVLDSAFEDDTARANIATLYKQRKDEDGKPVCNLKVV
ncbi:MAG: site-specific DNA-methyltransferase [Phycisphaeraceae bacterium]